MRGGRGQSVVWAVIYILTAHSSNGKGTNSKKEREQWQSKLLCLRVIF